MWDTAWSLVRGQASFTTWVGAFVGVFIIFVVFGQTRSLCIKPARRRPPGHPLCIVVTGAASGIGRGIVEELLAGHDEDICVVGIDLQPLGYTHARLHSWQADVTDMDALKRIVVEMTRLGLACDALCLAAGLSVTGPLVELPPQRIKLVMDVNVLGMDCVVSLRENLGACVDFASCAIRTRVVVACCLCSRPFVQDTFCNNTAFTLPFTRDR